MSENLKPCPFCGCIYLYKNKTMCTSKSGDQLPYYSIVCLNCGCRTGLYPKGRRDEAIIVWQARTDKPDTSKVNLLLKQGELDEWD